MIFTILFWFAVGALFYTYVGYPILLTILAHGKKGNEVRYTEDDEWPVVSILIAFHNESEVLGEKITNLDLLDYPSGKLEILMGSDASDDGSDQLVHNWSSKHAHVGFHRFEKRTGKIPIINHLAEMARGEVLVISDANVLANPDALHQMIRHFKNSEIGLVDSNMTHLGIVKRGISVQEHSYISREMRMKHHESLVWGSMMGPSGGFYAVRKSLFQPVPPKFLVDDFYINMKVLTSGKKSMHESGALVFEDISSSIYEEFRRKIRISAGNFQNLSRFIKVLSRPGTAVAFTFLSHKVLRWLGPLFIGMAFISNVFLTSVWLYRSTFIMQLVLFSIPIIDLLLRKFNIHVVILRFVTHFYNMNLALLIGFGWFLKGVHSNVWEPTRRNQS
jgi:cellulose synthase/poly-beta-1,6-N-acetylglucosamine synthase-like glycosyltransferase